MTHSDAKFWDDPCCTSTQGDGDLREIRSSNGVMNSRLPVLFILFLTWPSFWNACGGVEFATQDANYKSCALEGADLSNCFNPQPESYVPVSQSLEVKAQTDVDILFVVDNSGSMQEEQVGIGNKIGGFLDKIKNLNWQIAITTTDDRTSTPITGDTNRPWGDGQFRPFDSNSGSQYILSASQVSLSDAQSKLSNAIQMGIGGSGTERGINATYRAVERSVQAGPQKDFFRSNAKLAVVVISDEDECSTGLSGCPSASADKSNPQNLISQIQNTLGPNKGFSFHSIIAIPGDSSCTTGGNAGNVYKSLSNLTSGVVSSVCSSDYSTPLSSIGSRVVELVNSVTLSCKPVDLNGDGKADVQIELADGRTLNNGFEVNGMNMYFQTPLPEGTHQFHFFCVN